MEKTCVAGDDFANQELGCGIDNQESGCGIGTTSEVGYGLGSENGRECGTTERDGCGTTSEGSDNGHESVTTVPTSEAVYGLGSDNGNECGTAERDGCGTTNQNRTDSKENRKKEIKRKLSRFKFEEGKPNGEEKMKTTPITKENAPPDVKTTMTVESLRKITRNLSQKKSLNKLKPQTPKRKTSTSKTQKKGGEDGQLSEMKNKKKINLIINYFEWLQGVRNKLEDRNTSHSQSFKNTHPRTAELPTPQADRRGGANEKQDIGPCEQTTEHGTTERQDQKIEAGNQLGT